MVTVELFAGAGGASLGLLAAGCEEVRAVEFDANACATRRAAGLRTDEGDVRDPAHYAGLGAVDLLWSSFPCQAWSSAGKRLGAADERNGWPWTTAALDIVRPRWFIAENVPGLTHHRGDCDRSGAPESCPGCYLERRILPDVAARFPWSSWTILDSADYGIVAKCPLHDSGRPTVSADDVARLFSSSTVPAYAVAPAMTPSDAQHLRDAWIVVEHWAKAIEQASVDDATHPVQRRHRRVPALLDQQIPHGRVGAESMSAAMSGSGWMGDTAESIDSWLRRSWDDLYKMGKLSTTWTATPATIIHRIWRSIATTAATEHPTCTVDQSAACGLCFDWATPQRRRRVYIVGGPHPMAWPTATHSETALAVAKWKDGSYWRRHGMDPVGEPTAGEARVLGMLLPPGLGLKPWRTVREVLGLNNPVRHRETSGWARPMLDEPGPTVGTKGTIFEENLKHPHARPDAPAPALRSGGADHSSPPMWLNQTGRGAIPQSRRPMRLDTPADTIQASGEGPRPPCIPTRAASRPELLDQPSPTVTTCEEKGTRGEGQHGGPDRASDAAWLGAGIRRLTVAECAALMSWPDGYPLRGTKTSQYAQVGNGCTPPVVEALVRAVIAADRERP